MDTARRSVVRRASARAGSREVASTRSCASRASRSTATRGLVRVEGVVAVAQCRRLDERLDHAEGEHLASREFSGSYPLRPGVGVRLIGVDKEGAAAPLTRSDSVPDAADDKADVDVAVVAGRL